MSLFCWGQNDRRDHICGTQRLLALWSWLRALEGTCTEVDADQAAWFWSCDLAYKEDGWVAGCTEPTAELGGLSTLLVTGRFVLNRLSGQLAQGSGELSPELPRMSAWELAVICSCRGRQGTCVTRKVNKRALVGHQLFKARPSDFSHFIVQNQHLCPCRSWRKQHILAFKPPWSPFADWALVFHHFCNSKCYIFPCPFSCVLQFHIIYGHVSGWLWFFHLYILWPRRFGQIGLFHFFLTCVGQ